MDVRRDLRADSEDELLRMQAEFAASGKAPAARVTALRPNQFPAHSTQETRHGESSGPVDTSAGAEEAHVHASETADGWQIVGDVCERQPDSASAQHLPPAHPTDAFPKATHRKVSKFALSRRAKGAPSKPEDEPSRRNAIGVPAQSISRPAGSGLGPGSNPGLKSSGGAQPARLQQPAFAPSSCGQTGSLDAEGEMAQEIAAENQKLLASMQPDEVEKTKQEIRDRLDPKVLAFLQKRAAQRQSQKEQPNPVAASSMASQSGAGQAASRTDAVEGSLARSEMVAAHDQGLAHSSLLKASGSPASSEESPAACMRFDMSGDPMGFKDSSSPSQPATERDLLRQNEGALGSGYTIQEMCELARSSVPAQRVAACRHLAAILARVQEGLLSEPEASVTTSPEGERVTWQALWRHMAQDCQVAIILRLALDDANAGVIAAAAAAMHALLGGGRTCSELGFLDTELPVVPVRHLERPHPSAAWTSQWAAPEEDPSFPQNAAEAGDVGTDPCQLAKHDSLAALLHMQVLDRLKYLLTSAAAPAALEPALALLGDLALGGADVAHAISDTPGLVAALMAILDLHSAVAGSQAAAKAEMAARPAALRALCFLCQAGTHIARRLLAEGLESRVLRFVMGPAMRQEGAHQPDQAALQLQAIALRVWRVLATLGLSSMSLDDAYPAICRHLEPTWPPATAPGVPEGSHMELCAEALWTCCVVLQTAGTPRETAHISEECSAAVLKAASSWLQPPALGSVQERLQGLLEPGQAPVSSHAAAVLSAFGAAANITALAKGENSGLLLELACKSSEAGDCPGPGLMGGLVQLLRTSRDTHQHAESLSRVDYAETVLAGSAALRACLTASRASHPQLAFASAAEVVKTLAEVIQQESRGQKADMCIEPWEALQQELEQSQVRTLLTAVELLQSMCKEDSDAGRKARAFLRQHLLQLSNALMWALTALPPGAEDLALRALSCLLHGSLMESIYTKATAAVKAILKGDSTLAEAALRHNAWWQKDAAVSEPAQLPDLEQLRERLLHAYAAHWLGLVPEGAQSEGRAVGQPAMSSLIRQPTGSRLPLPVEWPFNVELGQAAQPDAHSGLEPIPEEASGRPPKMSSVAGCLLFALGLESAGNSFKDAIPTGARLSRVLDLLFGPKADSSSAESSTAPWTDPTVRQAAAALLHLHLARLFDRECDVEASLGSISEADAARWTLEFASASFGDPLLASAVALLLLPQMPQGVQVTVLDVLDQEGALHLLPSLEQVSSMSSQLPARVQPLFLAKAAPAEVVQMYRRLLVEGRLQKASELQSLPHSMAVRHSA